MVQVVVGALVTGARVLLAHRSPQKVAFPGVWDLPGGVIEPGESELGALKRELHEELGVRIDPDAAAPLCRVTVRPVREPVTLGAWLVPSWEGTPANVAPHEHDDLAWFTAADLPPLVDPQVRAAVLEALRADEERASRW